MNAAFGLRADFFFAAFLAGAFFATFFATFFAAFLAGAFFAAFFDFLAVAISDLLVGNEDYSDSVLADSTMLEERSRCVTAILCDLRRESSVFRGKNSLFLGPRNIFQRGILRFPHHCGWCAGVSTHNMLVTYSEIANMLWKLPGAAAKTEAVPRPYGQPRSGTPVESGRDAACTLPPPVVRLCCPLRARGGRHRRQRQRSGRVSLDQRGGGAATARTGSELPHHPGPRPGCGNVARTGPGPRTLGAGGRVERGTAGGIVLPAWQAARGKATAGRSTGSVELSDSGPTAERA